MGTHSSTCVPASGRFVQVPGAGATTTQITATLRLVGHTPAPTIPCYKSRLLRIATSDPPMAQSPQPLKFLSPAWFTIVMGFCGLSLAWHRAAGLMGELADGIALVLGGVAALLFVALAAASVLRLQRHPEAWKDDRQHPVRHAFMAAIPAAGILLATVSTALFGAGFVTADPASGVVVEKGLLQQLTAGLWWAASLGQLGATLWVMQRWWLGNKAGGLNWPAVTPALLIPVVGNVLVPLAGVTLGYPGWSAAQFGIGLVFWPLVLALLLVRLAVQGLWPERVMPSAFILIAPPAVMALSALQLGAPAAVAWGFWGVSLFCLLWVAPLLKRIGSLPFGAGHWALSFPLAALAGLTLALAEPGSLLAVAGPMLLALTSLVFVGLTLGTVRGLREGSLLAPEQVATIQPIGAPLDGR
jgi:tellurite resistance protein